MNGAVSHTFSLLAILPFHPTRDDVLHSCWQLILCIFHTHFIVLKSQYFFQLLDWRQSRAQIYPSARAVEQKPVRCSVGLPFANMCSRTSAGGHEANTTWINTSDDWNMFPTSNTDSLAFFLFPLLAFRRSASHSLSPSRNNDLEICANLHMQKRPNVRRAAPSREMKCWKKRKCEAEQRAETHPNQSISRHLGHSNFNFTPENSS